MKDPNDKVTVDIFDQEPTDTEILKWMAENLGTIERWLGKHPQGEYFKITTYYGSSFTGTTIKDAVKEAMKCSNS